jgi:hypothetical protein
LTNMEQASRENAFYYKVHQQGCVDQHGAGFQRERILLQSTPARMC